jgi:CHAT domain-containing protein
LHLDFAGGIYYAAIAGNGTVESGRPETGLQYCNILLRMVPLVKDVGFPFIAYQGKARALLGLHRRAEAQAVLGAAIAAARAQNNYFALTQLLVVNGDAESNPQKAIQSLREAAEISKEEGFHHVYAWSTWQLAKAYRDAGDLERSAALTTETIGIMRELEDRNHLPLHLSLLADVEAKKGNFAQADQLYSAAIDVIEGLLVNVSSPQIRASLISTLSDAYVGRFELAATKLSNPEKAYEIIERARGRALADSIRAGTQTIVTSDSLSVEAQKKINGIQIALLHELDGANRQSLLDTLFAAEQLLSPVRRSGFSRSTSPIALRTVQRSIDSDEILLEYVLAESESYCLQISRSRISIIGLSVGREQIESLVEAFLKDLRTKQNDNQASSRLFSILLQPVIGASSPSRLTIVPDGKLHLLPFDALKDTSGKYVIESQTVTYVPSASVLHLLRSEPSPDQYASNFLGIGNVKYSHLNAPKSTTKTDTDRFFDVTRLTNLPGTKEEVLSVAEILHGNNQLLLGNSATEARLKALPLSEFRVIHLAVHGIADTQFPDRAALVLGTGSGEDGLLQAREISDLSIRAQMVTLSACDTGIGRLLGAEGIASLENSFLLAGAKSVVASLWAADDWSSTAVMGHIYRNLMRGLDAGTALREARLEFLSDFGEQALPQYWAGFVVVGNGSIKPFTKASK